jgi:hypothetical protein
MKAVESYGLRGTLDHIKRTGSFPRWGRVASSNMSEAYTIFGFKVWYTNGYIH